MRELGLIALRLRNNCSSEVWEQFLAEFSAYTASVTVAVTEAPPNDILRMQGQAQQLRSLERMFKECAVQKS